MRKPLENLSTAYTALENSTFENVDMQILFLRIFV